MLNEISIEIIRKCTNNCIHCSSMSNEKCTEILDFSKFKEIVIDAKELGARTICFSGGEPFLHNVLQEQIDKDISIQAFDANDEKIATPTADNQDDWRKVIFNIEVAN